MRLELTRRDFEDALGEDVVQRDFDRDEELLGSRTEEGETDLARSVLDAVPRALAARVRRLVPETMTLAELKFTISVEGKPFGVGVGGEVEVVLRTSD